jgi:glycosyltransferase involved in cell wall biosynthesis
MNGPLVSVIVPCYNAARLLPEAVASIHAQRYEPLEILVVDDGSTDETPAVASGFGSAIRYFQKPNGGPASARNLGLREARGELIAFLDADDQWPEYKIELQAGRLLADPELDVVTGRVQYIELPGGEIPRLQFEGPDNTLAFIQLGAGLYRRRAFDRAGFFDETLRFSEDHDWFLRAREAALKIVVLAEVTLLYRLHESNMTRDAKARDFKLTAVIHKSLERRRRKSGTAAELPTWSSFDEKRGTEEGGGQGNE